MPLKEMWEVTGEFLELDNNWDWVGKPHVLGHFDNEEESIQFKKDIEDGKYKDKYKGVANVDIWPFTKWVEEEKPKVNDNDTKYIVGNKI